MEQSKNSLECNCECCHCKKIFMLLVLLILSFMAGIMVGNCTMGHHPRHHYLSYPTPAHTNLQKIQSQPSQVNQNPETDTSNTVSGAQIGGYLIEIGSEQ